MLELKLGYNGSNGKLIGLRIELISWCSNTIKNSAANKNNDLNQCVPTWKSDSDIALRK